MVAQRPLEVRYEVEGKTLPLSLRSQGNNAPLVQSKSLRVGFRLPRRSGVGFLPSRRLLVPFQKLPFLAMRQCRDAATWEQPLSRLLGCVPIDWANKRNRIKPVVQAHSQPDKIGILPLLTAIFVRPDRPVVPKFPMETLLHRLFQH